VLQHADREEASRRACAFECQHGMNIAAAAGKGGFTIGQRTQLVRGPLGIKGAPMLACSMPPAAHWATPGWTKTGPEAIHATIEVLHAPWSRPDGAWQRACRRRGKDRLADRSAAWTCQSCDPDVARIVLAALLTETTESVQS
jgi:hypothetical protein